MRKQGILFRLAIVAIAILVAIQYSGCADKVAATTAVKPGGPGSIVRTEPAPDFELIRGSYAKGEVLRLCTAAIDEAKRALDGIGSGASPNPLLALEDALADFNDSAMPLTFMGYVSTDEGTSAEGSECERQVSELYVTILTRRDLYDAVKAVADSGSPLSPSEARLLSETLRGFEMNGLALSDEKLAKVRELKSKLAQLESKFSENLNNDRSTIELSEEELEGVPASVLSRLKRSEGGKVIVTTKGTDYVPVIQNAARSETRRQMLLAYTNRAADTNTALMEEAIRTRRAIAAEMGFETWADYRIKGRMARDAATVRGFLEGLRAKLSERNRRDLDKLLAFKREGDASAERVDAWDVNYLAYQLQKRDFQLDNEEIRPYFPADTVLEGMFAAYSRLLGVKYVELEGAKVWAEGVKLYRIEDAADGSVLSYFYADFFPRAGKYGHAAAFPLISGRSLGEHYSKPVASIVANFNPPAGGKPSLLSHDEVETVFHEFGHIMHQTLTRALFASLSGSAVAQDFVEAPSQMLEGWVWSPEILSSLSGHYEDASRKLPKELLDKMIAAKDFNSGYAYTRQLLFGLFDLTLHTAEGDVDVTETYDRMHGEITGIPAVEGGHFPASFGHLMGGYDAGYYGYLWSEVYAADMFTRFETEGLLNPATGGDYRRFILESGSMRDAIDLLRDFLGREPNSEAFFRKLGITGS